MNERLIYEWFREELKGKNWRVLRDNLGPSAVLLDEKQARFLPDLDMNTWFDEVVPKLRGEGVDVAYTSPYGMWSLFKSVKDYIGDNSLCTIDALAESTNPYDALTEYLEANQ